jgi:hypothetical protein
MNQQTTFSLFRCISGVFYPEHELSTTKHGQQQSQDFDYGLLNFRTGSPPPPSYITAVKAATGLETAATVLISLIVVILICSAAIAIKVVSTKIHAEVWNLSI